MADLTTYSQVNDELAATAAFDASNDITLAQRRVAALRRKLDFAESSDENGRMIKFNHQVVQKQLDQVLEWIKVNSGVTATDSVRLLDPTVLHADFSGFGGYQ